MGQAEEATSDASVTKRIRMLVTTCFPMFPKEEEFLPLPVILKPQQIHVKGYDIKPERFKKQEKKENHELPLRDMH